MNLSEVLTPALTLDLGKFRRNCERMVAKCRDLGVPLRPHMKTMKSIEAARIAIDPAHGGIAVSTLQEAEYFAGHGVDDIQLALCITPDKLNRAAAISRSIPRFSFFLDSVEVARAVADFARAEGVAFQVWIEIDSGDGRTGVVPGSDLLIPIAEALKGSPAVLAGVATHGGHSYSGRDRGAITAVAEQERLKVVEASERLRAAGQEVPGVSAGSTPTAVYATSGEGLTEIRAGVYMAGDLFQAGIESQTRDDIAMSVLATVISHKRLHNQIVIDAGGLALSKDRSTSAIEGGDLGYGLVVDVEGKPAYGRMVVAGVHQEHGEIQGDMPLPFDQLPIGTKVRILPNHACMTAAAYDRFLVVDGGTDVSGTWHRTNGW
ncbi:MAG TPA: alanine racemase [Allosphingosinicella sp.]|nr:alanine racemase [Allosphingosinicella sp.]